MAMKPRARPAKQWPCHSKPKEQWCDRHGPGGFMGHTCEIKAGDRPASKPIFELFDATTRKRIGAIYADGRVEGFRRKLAVVNRIPDFLRRSQALMTAGVGDAAAKVFKELGL